MSILCVNNSGAKIPLNHSHFERAKMGRVHWWPIGLLDNALKNVTDPKRETKVTLTLKLLKNGMTCRDSILSNVAIFVVYNIVTLSTSFSQWPFEESHCCHSTSLLPQPSRSILLVSRFQPLMILSEHPRNNDPPGSVSPNYNATVRTGPFS